MTQRNPMNDRYQTKDHQGQTRKSAASAKPKTKAASSVTVQTKKQAKTPKESKDAQKLERAKKREMRAKYYNPDTPEYHRWRSIWIGFLVASVCFLGIGWFGTSFLPTAVSYMSIGLAYACVFGAIYVDMAKLRKIRNAYAQKMDGGKSKEARAAEKKAKAEKRAASQEVQSEEPAQRSTGIGKFFGK